MQNGSLTYCSIKGVNADSFLKAAELEGPKTWKWHVFKYETHQCKWERFP